MKHGKKLLALLLALVMILSLSITAFAAAQEGDLTGGSITINGAVPGETYNAYQILYLESYDTTKGVYAYKANSEWEDWLKTDTEAQKYLKFDTQGYVTWVTGADSAAFATLLKGQLTGKAVAATADAPAAADGATNSTVILPKEAGTSLNLGYYLVDTTLGTLCSLNTTKPDVTLTEKNEQPTIEKQISTGGKNSTAKIGDTVDFTTTIHAKKGARNYKLHDQMEAGFTLIQDTATETKIVVTEGSTTLTKGSDYTIAYDVACTDAAGNAATCDFEITFTQTYLDKITGDTDIVVTYSAILNGNAEISPNTNDNNTNLSYGKVSHTAWDTTTTTTYEFDIVKTDSANKLLDGAEFELYDAKENGNKIDLVIDEGVYRPATSGETTAKIVVTGGKVTVKGLNSATYWLQETKAPSGYNQLSTRTEVKIETKNLKTTMEGDTWADGNGGVHIVNQSGTELPATGGIGTTLFYILGGILVVCAGVLLVTKRRMRGES